MSDIEPKDLFRRVEKAARRGAQSGSGGTRDGLSWTGIGILGSLLVATVGFGMNQSARLAGGRMAGSNRCHRRKFQFRFARRWSWHICKAVACVAILGASNLYGQDEDSGGQRVEDLLREIKRATVAIGRPTGSVGGIPVGQMEIVSSGFLYAYAPHGLSPERSPVWVVTCRHSVWQDVVSGGAIAVRVNTKSAGKAVDRVVVRRWYVHATEDVAVALLRVPGIHVDDQSRDRLVPIQGFELEVEPLSADSVAFREDMIRLGLYEYTPVAIVGFPIGMNEEGSKDYPVVRSGRIAQIQGYFDGDPEHRSFLVDGSVFGGNSGGPVVVPNGTWTTGLQILKGTAVIGIVSNRRVTPIAGELGATSTPDGFENADLTGVIAMEVVRELIERATVGVTSVEELTKRELAATDRLIVVN